MTSKCVLVRFALFAVIVAPAAQLTYAASLSKLTRQVENNAQYIKQQIQEAEKLLEEAKEYKVLFEGILDRDKLCKAETDAVKEPLEKRNKLMDELLIPVTNDKGDVVKLKNGRPKYEHSSGYKIREGADMQKVEQMRDYDARAKDLLKDYKICEQKVVYDPLRRLYKEHEGRAPTSNQLKEYHDYVFTKKSDAPTWIGEQKGYIKEYEHALETLKRIRDDILPAQRYALAEAKKVEGGLENFDRCLRESNFAYPVFAWDGDQRKFSYCEEPI